MWVKICANTNVEDTLRAAEFGADAVGFVFAPSKRQVTPAQVRAITSLLPSNVERVGVFTTDDAGLIASTVHEAQLDAVQMHGGLNLAAAARLRDLVPRLSIVHVVHWNIGESASSNAHRMGKELLALRDTRLDERILIDASTGGSSGGLGITFDWSEAACLTEDFPHLRFIVAGGLHPENVISAVQVLKPFGVDVASGVESAPGHKDYTKLKLFIGAARRGVSGVPRRNARERAGSDRES